MPLNFTPEGVLSQGSQAQKTPIKKHPEPSQGPVICVYFSSLPAGENQLTGFWQRLNMLVSS